MHHMEKDFANRWLAPYFKEIYNRKKVLKYIPIYYWDSCPN